MTKKRRYPVDDERYDEYHQEYHARRQESDILNRDVSKPTAHSRTLGDKGRLEYEMSRIMGGGDAPETKGHFYDSTESKWFLAVIPSLTDQFEDLKGKIKEYQQSRKLNGHEIPRNFEEFPQDYPKELVRKLLKAQALFDCRIEEYGVLHHIKDKLFDSPAQNKSDNRILHLGLIQGAWGDPCREIDYQKVSRLSDGTPFIDDEHSKYDGILLSDYRKLARQWRRDTKQELKEKWLKKREALIAGGKDPEKLSKSPPIRNKKWKQSELPAFPAWAENVKKDKKDNDS